MLYGKEESARGEDQTRPLWRPGAARSEAETGQAHWRNHVKSPRSKGLVSGSCCFIAIGWWLEGAVAEPNQVTELDHGDTVHRDLWEQNGRTRTPLKKNLH